MGCTGNSSEACGGSSRLNLFWSGASGPQTNPGPGLWKFSGCYTYGCYSLFLLAANSFFSEGTNGRALIDGVDVAGGSSNMTVSNCLAACQASEYDLAGIEYSGECCKFT